MISFVNPFNSAFIIWQWYLHIAKRLSDLKQNGTHKKTPFSGTVFQSLSHGVLRFVASVSFKNHWIEASDWLSKNLNQSESGFLSYHSQQNWPHHVKGYWKLCQKLVSCFVYHFVWGHLGVLKDVRPIRALHPILSKSSKHCWRGQLRFDFFVR